ncbi:hypothetical protein RHOFW510R12_00485 [Rhodanobacter sp. FW510-R12]|uniref:hypothetical protein n=1 Tax=Rhodanobacter thiooxydans TaxID=416169 RepID=UPI0009127313|nr:hypothetical protein [Rhodanobacter thiooxydans]UJJ56718.1 hypothetical protein LRK53_19100 [Rhodanobacter thiooxydans]
MVTFFGLLFFLCQIAVAYVAWRAATVNDRARTIPKAAAWFALVAASASIGSTLSRWFDQPTIERLWLAMVYWQEQPVKALAIGYGLTAVGIVFAVGAGAIATQLYGSGVAPLLAARNGNRRRR